MANDKVRGQRQEASRGASTKLVRKQKVHSTADRPPGKAADLAGRKAVRADDAPRAALSAEERRAMIAKAAYYRAERRGFDGESSEQDWLEAEAEIDAALAARSK